MPSPEQIDWYDTPLYYDIVFDADSPAEGDFLEAVHRQYGLGNETKRSVLEPACGTGRLVLEMAQRGWSVAGFDANEEMLRFARGRLREWGGRATVWEDRMESFAVPRGRKFDLAHCLVSSFKYLLTEAHAAACLQRVADSLRRGGLFALGLHLTDYVEPKVTHERWVGKRDGVEVVSNTRTWPADRKARLEPIRSRLKITPPNGEVRLQETHWQARTYSAKELKRLIAKVPSFELVACHDFRYDIEERRGLDDSYEDIILILRKQ